MLPILSRGCLGALMVLQTLQPAMGWNWYVADEPCCGEVEWDCCESEIAVADDTCGCESETVVVNECGCGGEAEDSQATEPAQQPEPASQPEPAQSNKAQTPEAETPQPTLDPAEVLPPAPINVPTTPPSTAVESNAVDPGPAPQPAIPAETEPAAVTPTQPTPTDIIPPSTTPAAEPSEQPSDSAGSLFEEPTAETSVPGGTESAPATEPAASAPAEDEPAAEEQPTESAPVDDMFGEPSPPADDSSGNSPVIEEESVEVEGTETEAPETESTEKPADDPLDDLFGPSSAVESPQPDYAAGEILPIAPGSKTEVRRWSNRDNKFQGEGRLVHMTSEGVFIAKLSGEVVAIAFSQLSDSDLAFMHDHVQAERALLAQQDADAQVASHGVR